MPKKNSTPRRRSPNLPKQYRDATHAVRMTLDFTPRGAGDPMERRIIDIYEHSKSAMKANITVMCKLAGVSRTTCQSNDFEVAIREALRRQAAEGFDPARVLRRADNIARVIEIHGKVRGEQGTQPKTAPTESHRDKTRRAVFEGLRANALLEMAERNTRLRLGAASVSDDYFACYNIRRGDVLTVTLDGDAEHGELAYVSWYGLDEKERFWTYGFLFIEGDHFCVRSESHLECDGDHYDAGALTVVGRVVAVERGGLPVRLKGLELRGLPYAEDLAAVKDED